MEISDDFLCGLTDDDASQLELALKYALPEKTTTKQKVAKRKTTLKRRKKASSSAAKSESQEKFSCGKCTKLFPTQQRLSKHLRNAHLPVKYECAVCKKPFTRKDLLRDHENSHSDQPLFECKRCKKLFRKNACLRQHERKHEKEEQTNCVSNEGETKQNVPENEVVEDGPSVLDEKQCSELLSVDDERPDSPKLGDACVSKFADDDLKQEDLSKEQLDLGFTTENEKVEFESFRNLENVVLLEDNRNNKEEGPFICDKCKKFFPSNQRLKKHLRNAHLSGKFRCPICEKLFTRRDLCKDHIYTHSDERKYKCNYKKCKKSFHMLISLRQHEKIHKRKHTSGYSSSDDDDASESEENRCCSREACLEVRGTEPPRSNSVSPYGFKEYIEEDATEMKLALELGTTESACEIDEREEGEEFICFHCFRKFTSHEDMLLHIEDEHFTFVCDVCNKQFPTDKRLKKHQRDAHLQGKFRCPICDKLFTRKDICKDHVYTHSEKPLFKCKYDNCTKTFNKPFSLKQHEKIHTNSNRRTCPICSESVVQLSKHLNSHLKTKQYPCGSCDKSFSRLNYLQEHEKIHLGEKGFVCDECHVEFKSSNVLYKHKRSKHAKEKYICEVPDCGQEFNRKDNMTTHMRRVHKLKVETLKNQKNDIEADE